MLMVRALMEGAFFDLNIMVGFSTTLLPPGVLDHRV
jgi:hypothetical protein